MVFQTFTAENAAAIITMSTPQADVKEHQAAGAVPAVIIRHPVRMPPADGCTIASAGKRP